MIVLDKICKTKSDGVPKIKKTKDVSVSLDRNGKLNLKQTKRGSN